MQYPYFFEPSLSDSSLHTMSEESSRHMIQVLRMKEGDVVQITNGKGLLATARIRTAHKKKAETEIFESSTVPPAQHSVTVAVSLVKNTSRYEWFLEKATEIGVSEIVPLLCKRTEKTHFRQDRMQSILVSAMLQSRQVWLPVLHEPVKMESFIADDASTIKLIAHCVEDEKNPIDLFAAQDMKNISILIGPEGDFTAEEIQQALTKGYQPVSLGATRLRTETAAIVAAVKLCI